MQHVVEVLEETQFQGVHVLLEEIRELHLFRVRRGRVAVVSHHDAVLRQLVFVQAEAVVEGAPGVLRLLQRALTVVSDLRVAEVGLEVAVVLVAELLYDVLKSAGILLLASHQLLD